MRTCRPFSLALGLFLLLLPLPARAALTPVGAPLVIADDPLSCSFDAQLEVVATPKGAFEVVWVDETNFDIRGLRFARNLQPTGPTRRIMPLHGGLFVTNFASTWAGGPYELAINTLDFGNNPGDPVTAFRTQIGLGGVPLGPANRVKPPRFVELAPAAGGDSLQFRMEPPFFGPNTCRSLGVLASRVARNGAPLTAESRVNRRASAWAASLALAVDQLPNDNFIAVYETCQQFTGVVARRLNASGAPVGKPINLPLPARLGNFSPGIKLMVAARGVADFAVGTMLSTQLQETSGTYISAVANGEVFGPIRISGPGPSGFTALIDLEASPAGGYLLLFWSGGRFFAQELDAEGIPQDEPLELIEDGGFNIIEAAAASLPNGRWIVVTRSQRAVIDVSCEDRVRGIVLAGG